jgi:hypothetical protein
MSGFKLNQSISRDERYIVLVVTHPPHLVFTVGDGHGRHGRHGGKEELPVEAVLPEPGARSARPQAGAVIQHGPTTGWRHLAGRPAKVSANLSYSCP